mmetsp:Transcript_23113/g.22528  ORF Transcript_23113/g.22528 Transcript_23113/m.22528 type:complete len:203 (+) Transcript_23113:115-723(+)
MLFLLDHFLLILIAFFGLLDPLFLLHDLIERVGLEVQLVRELKVVVEFVVLEGVEVEHEPLQVHNEHIGGLGDEHPFADVHLLAAPFALVVVDHLPLHQLLQALMHRLDVLHCQTQIVEILNTIPHLPTLLTDQLAAGLPAEDALEQVLPAGALQHVLQPLKGQVQKLLSILLLPSVRRVPINFFEGEAELHGVVVGSLREF